MSNEDFAILVQFPAHSSFMAGIFGRMQATSMQYPRKNCQESSRKSKLNEAYTRHIFMLSLMALLP